MWTNVGEMTLVLQNVANQKGAVDKLVAQLAFGDESAISEVTLKCKNPEADC